MEWDYFLSIEEDFIRTIPYVEPCEKNFDAHSIKYAKILLAAASEADAVLKRLCRVIADQDVKGERCYRDTLIKECNVPLQAVTVGAFRYGMSAIPWDSYNPSNPRTPDWWSAYNKVKHRLDEGYEEATLKNAFHSICGLFVALLFLYRAEGYKHLSPAPELLTIESGFWTKRTRLLGADEPALLIIDNLPEERKACFKDAACD